jgi:putative spermidine/putrescine transport system substrate-binding protein
MSEIKPHIKVWWREGSQSQQLIRDGEVDMIAMWSARAVDLIDDKVPLELVWNGAEIFNSNLIVPKGDPIRLSRLLGPSLSSEKGRQGNRTPCHLPTYSP